MAKIIPHLWYSEKAEEAARFYASLIPDSRVESITTLPADTPSGPEGRCKSWNSISPANRSWPSMPARSIPSTMPSHL